jgi:hypothetical protein
MRTLTTLTIVGIVAGCSAGAPSPDPSPSPETTQGELPGPAPSVPGAAPAPAATMGRADTARSAAGSISAHAMTTSVEANLASLRELRIFEVRGIIDVPEGANCYGLPCPGEELQFFESKQKAARRLGEFTSTAIHAAASPASDAYAPQTGPVAEHNLQSLKDLKVVALGGLILEEPKNNPNCYNVPCETDRAAADEINRDRACRLASIAAAFRLVP